MWRLRANWSILWIQHFRHKCFSYRIAHTQNNTKKIGQKVNIAVHQSKKFCIGHTVIVGVSFWVEDEWSVLFTFLQVHIFSIYWYMSWNYMISKFVVCFRTKASVQKKIGSWTLVCLSLSKYYGLQTNKKKNVTRDIEKTPFKQTKK